VDQDGDALSAIPGTPPNMTRKPKGCPFAPRCNYVIPRCREVLDPLTEWTAGRKRACNVAVKELA
jgi:oligopeptide transport system ATP-binding protein